MASPPSAGKVGVVFREAGEKVLSLRHAKLERLSDDAPADPWLEEMQLSEFGSGAPYLGPREAVERFVARFPGGFQGERYLQEERADKVAAHEFARTELSRDALRKARRGRRYEPICKAALRLMSLTKLVYPNDRALLRKALSAPAGRALFVAALDDSLYGRQTPDVRFQRLVEALSQLGIARWTLVTYWNFVRYPEEYMLLRPQEVQQAAALSRFDLDFRPEVNRRTFGRLLAFARVLSHVTAELSPADMFDVYAFLRSMVQEAE